MDDVILVKGSDAFDDGEESIEDFLFIEMDDVVAPLPIFDLRLKCGLLLSVEESIIVPDGSQKRRVVDAAFSLYVS
jgi:hypothetical protein